MKYFILIISFLALTKLYSQNEINFGQFVGKAIFMPINEIKLGHGKHIYDNKVIGDLVFDELQIKKQNVEIFFPGVTQRSQFGILLNSKLEIFKSGCIVFWT